MILGCLAPPLFLGYRLELALAAKRGALGRCASELAPPARVAAIEGVFASIQKGQASHIEYKRAVLLHNQPVSLEGLERYPQDGIVVGNPDLRFEKPTATVCEHPPLIINGR
jgi:hypothetical protein